MRYPKFTLLAAAVAVACAAPYRVRLEPPRGAVHHPAPKVDATDFYMFRSYEAGRDGYVTIVANYLPLQDPYGGPNYFTLDPDAVYEIHDRQQRRGGEDLTFQFRFTQHLQQRDSERRRQERAGAARAARSDGSGIGSDDGAERDREVHRRAHPRQPPHRHGGNRRTNLSGRRHDVRQAASTTSAPRRFPTTRPTRPATSTTIGIPGCETAGCSSASARIRSSVNLGEMFDLVNLDPGRCRRDRRAEHARGQERDLARARSADRVPHLRRAAR